MSTKFENILVEKVDEVSSIFLCRSCGFITDLKLVLITNVNQNDVNFALSGLIYMLTKLVPLNIHLK